MSRWACCSEMSSGSRPRFIPSATVACVSASQFCVEGIQKMSVRSVIAATRVTFTGAGVRRAR